MKNKRWRNSCLLLGGYLIAANTTFAAPISQTEVIPVIRINTAQKSATEIGIETGRKSKALFSNIERSYDAYLSTLLTQALFNRIIRDTLPQRLAQLAPEYRDELKGVASAWTLVSSNTLGDGKLSLDEYHILNLLPDLHTAPDGVAFAVLGKASAQKIPIVGRNLDMQSSPELRRMQAITVFHNQEKSMVNIGFAGIISVLSGFNDSGLFLSYFNAEPYSPYKKNTQQFPSSPRSSVFDIRNALETSDSTQQAIRQFSNKTYANSHSILVADKHAVSVLEYAAGGKNKIRNWRSPTRADKPWQRNFQIAVIDCLVLASMPNNCKDIKDTYRWERLQQLAEFSAENPATVEDIAKILFDMANREFRIFNPQTLQSMVYSPNSGNLYLYTENENGDYPEKPIHTAYLDLLSSKTAKKDNDNGESWLLGILLLALVSMTAWITFSNKKTNA